MQFISKLTIILLVIFSPATVIADNFDITFYDDNWGNFRIKGIFGEDVRVGGTVTFTNLSKKDHTIVTFGRALSEGRGFDTGILISGASAVVTIKEPGIYDYQSKNFPFLYGSFKAK